MMERIFYSFDLVPYGDFPGFVPLVKISSEIEVCGGNRPIVFHTSMPLYDRSFVLCQKKPAVSLNWYLGCDELLIKINHLAKEYDLKTLSDEEVEEINDDFVITLDREAIVSVGEQINRLTDEAQKVLDDMLNKKIKEKEQAERQLFGGKPVAYYPMPAYGNPRKEFDAVVNAGDDWLLLTINNGVPKIYKRRKDKPKTVFANKKEAMDFWVKGHELI